ncbi:MAG TPA: tRNA pseudouridine(55) synthase TruB [Solirubrobacteraceae bacterium]
MSDGAGWILPADKPAGPSSHDLVSRARRALGVRRIGHAGTLDPFATGLLLLLVGRATRLARYFVELPKIYEAVARLGWTSTTGDPEGEIVETGRVPEPLVLPLGEIAQRPPAYSAVKVAGERSYARARRGEAVETPVRSVTVHESELLWREDDRVGLRYVCSSGTYVRSLVADLGDAYCLSLRRLAVGPFSVEEDAWGGEGPIVGQLLEVGAAWRRFGSVVELRDGEEERAVANGRPIEGRGVGGPVLLVGAGGEPFAVARERDGALRVEVGLRGGA